MSPALLLAIVFGYFLVLLAIAWYTSRGAGEHSFYSGDRKSLWYVVAFGMIGTSLSGVTFISVPGYVEAKAWTYFQLVFGFAIGYWIVAGVLLPLYYRMQLTSIYGYLRERFGLLSYRTGASFFILSRLAGATIRIFVVLNVIQLFVLDAMGVPFELTAFAVMVMIVLYTLKGGVKTIVWTDTLQTLFMLGALVGTIIYITGTPGMDGWWAALQENGSMRMLDLDWRSDSFFFKQVLAGMFITIAMTGLDQEMMQKNLSVATVEGSQKNMRVFSVILLGVNLLFLLLGALLYLYIQRNGVPLPTHSDDVFPSLALQQFPPWLGLLFIIGLISALFPSADGALTALTASTCIDLIGIRDRGWDEARQKRIRQRVHLGMAGLFLAFILYFHWLDTPTVIKTLFDIAGFTYGPLLGLFAFGLLFKGKPNEAWVPWVCVAAPLATYFLRLYSEVLFFGYKMGFEVLLVVAGATLLGLALASPRAGTVRH
ncbi:MAG: sodium:solute symporter [Flavobacteriales bacterium]|nr:sodium:solute symporter [Flavobacteriales bacterium]MBP9079677.1 sodium:solute symporter [Flavobacteriales bacterium]